MGTVQKNLLLLYALPMVNETEKAVRITRTSNSCGCAVATPPNHNIPPGESVTCVVAIRPKSLGNFVSRISITYSDDGLNAEKTCSFIVSGAAFRRVEIDQDRVVLSESERIFSLDVSYPLAELEGQTPSVNFLSPNQSIDVRLNSACDSPSGHCLDIVLPETFWEKLPNSEAALVLVSRSRSGDELEHSVRLVNASRTEIRPRVSTVQAKVGEEVRFRVILKGEELKRQDDDVRCCIFADDIRSNLPVVVSVERKLAGAIILTVSFQVSVDVYESSDVKLAWWNGKSKLGESKILFANR
ncbi:DUF1573 domain-containing protein [Rhodopirellula sp. P2]|nr:DUF1573 domain-containing protein [Rhodopirellula sp. P2]WDQ19524.1 DUF1573 domain-containing protein [Rhodopirellula sp. P2]